MKVVCHVCGQPFEQVPVIFDEEESDSHEEPSIYLVPEHPAVEGFAIAEIRNAKTGEVVGTMCDGSFRPPKMLVQ